MKKEDKKDSKISDITENINPGIQKFSDDIFKEDISKIEKENSAEKQQLSPEQLKQFLSMLQNKQPQSVTKFQKFKLGISNFIVNFIKTSIEYLDIFTKFILNKKDPNRADVVDNARGPILFGTYIIIIFMVIGGLWAALAPLDSASTAIGTVMPESKKKIIIHKTGGTVSEVHASTGDYLKEGDPILAFDTIEAKSAYEASLSRYRIEEAIEDRAAAEYFDYDHIIFDEFLLNDQELAEVQKIMQTQINLFDANRNTYDSQIKNLKTRIEIAKHNIQAAHDSKKSLLKTKEFWDDRLNSTKSLFKKGFVNKAQLLEVESNSAKIDSEVLRIDSEIDKAQQEFSAREVELNTFISDSKSKTLREYQEAQSRRNEAKERYNQTKDHFEKIVIKSPVNGTLIDLKFTTIGSYVPAGHIIAEVAPDDDNLIIDARIPSKFIDRVDVGLKVKIRFSAFKSRTTPSFTGTVVALSPDVVTDQEASRDFKNHELGDGKLYIAKIEIDREEFDKVAKARNLKLKPGMQAEIQIVTGTRTLLKYLLDPVTDNMFRSFNEK